MVHCPLSNSTHVRLLEKISVEKIMASYDSFGIDTRSIFKGIPFVFKYHSLNTGYKFFYPVTIQAPSFLYEELQKLDWYYQVGKWEHIKALEMIKTSDNVLEIGCGEGSFLSMVKVKFGSEPTGLEMNKKAVNKAVANGLKVYDQDIEFFSQKNQNTFDVICFFQVLEHIAKPIIFLQHALKMLKSGGRLIICVPNNDAMINSDHENPLNLPPHHMGLWNRQSLSFLAEILNLTVELCENEPLQDYHTDWYVRVLLMRMLGKTIYYKIISKTKLPTLIAKRVRAMARNIDGHSILFVFIK